MGVLSDFIGTKPAASDDEGTTSNTDDNTVTNYVEGEPKADEEKDKYTFAQACAFNTMMMFGTGPYISIPYCLAETSPPGPQAMIGYSMAAVGCLADSFVWGELGSRFPMSGGSYIYLRECFGPGTWGDLAAFIYLWQFWVSGPAEVASGFIAISEYLVYIHGAADYWTKALTALGLTIASTLLLLRRVSDTGIVVYVLWFITMASMIFVLIAGFANFDPNNFQLPDNPWGDPKTTSTSAFILSLGGACRFGVYDFTGYYDVCSMGGEVRKPRTTIPRSCIITCAIVLVVYLSVYASVIGYLPWYGEDGFVEIVLSESDSAAYIMAIFAEKLAGRAFAIFFVLVVVVVIFGSVFSMLAGMMYLPGAAAETGLFFSVFARRSKVACSQDVPVLSLLTIGTLACGWCFFSLDTVVDAMTTMLVLVQFIGQAFGLCALRWQIARGKRADDPAAWKIKFLPLVIIPQLAIFFFIFATTDNYLIRGTDPILDLALLFIFVGVVVFFIQQKFRKAWPFAPAMDVKQIEGKSVESSEGVAMATVSAASTDATKPANEMI